MVPAAPESGSAADADIIAATQRWIERAVLGLNLCPFARAPYIQRRLRFCVSHARDIDALSSDLRAELHALQSTAAESCETTLLIHPFVLADFLDYNDFLDVADELLRSLGMQGKFQIASFHPHYRFADTDSDDVANCSNRSPYPILHLLREASITQATASLTDSDSIYQRNIETLRRLGSDGWRDLWKDDSAPFPLPNSANCV